MSELLVTPLPEDVFEGRVKAWNERLRFWVEKWGLRCNPLWLNKLGDFKFEKEQKAWDKFAKVIALFEKLFAEEKKLMIVERTSLEKALSKEEVRTCIAEGFAVVIKDTSELKQPPGITLSEKALALLYGEL